jgi:glycosyltransferase involved in cell wall biosynthesis
MKDLSKLKVAIVHDWLIGGGAELVVLELHRMFPEAPIYTSYCSAEWQKKLDQKVVTGYLQHWPFSKLRKYLPILRQRWFRKLDLRGYDLVISSSGNGEAKFVTVEKPTIHICYCHSPTHFYWRHYEYYRQVPGFGLDWLVRPALSLLVKPLRKRDYQAAQRVDSFIANSTHIQSDIKTYYGRDAVVIHPPVDVERFVAAQATPRHGFVTVGRQAPYKRVDIIVDACTQLNLPLTVIGRGPEHQKLVKRAGPSVKFVEHATDHEITTALASAEAFILAAYEDFGITPVEALAAGTPVIAYKAGGALDYVVPNKTGQFFDKQTAAALAQTLSSFKPENFDHKLISEYAKQYATAVFTTNVTAFLTKLIKDGS